MNRCNSNKDFLDFAKSMGHTKRSAEELLKLQRLFVESRIANGEEVVITGLVSFKTRETSSTLHPGFSFRKIIARPAEKILLLSKRKGSR